MFLRRRLRAAMLEQPVDLVFDDLLTTQQRQWLATTSVPIRAIALLGGLTWRRDDLKYAASNHLKVRTCTPYHYSWTSTRPEHQF